MIYYKTIYSKPIYCIRDFICLAVKKLKKKNMYRMFRNTGMTYLKGLGVKDSTLWVLSGGDRSDESNSNG